MICSNTKFRTDSCNGSFVSLSNGKIILNFGRHHGVAFILQSCLYKTCILLEALYHTIFQDPTSIVARVASTSEVTTLLH